MFLNSTTVIPNHLPSHISVIALKHISSIEGDSLLEKMHNLLRVWFDRSVVQFSDLSSSQVESDVQNFYDFIHNNCNLPFLSDLIPNHPSLPYDYMSQTRLSVRCYNNLSNCLGS